MKESADPRGPHPTAVLGRRLCDRPINKRRPFCADRSIGVSLFNVILFEPFLFFSFFFLFFPFYSLASRKKNRFCGGCADVFRRSFMDVYFARYGASISMSRPLRFFFVFFFLFHDFGFAIFARFHSHKTATPVRAEDNNVTHRVDLSTIKLEVSTSNE